MIPMEIGGFPLDPSKPIMIDTYSGMGGASEAFMGGYNVYRYEINEAFSDPESKWHVPRTVKKDMLRFSFPRLPVHFLWGSPPCQEFSTAYNSIKSKAIRRGEKHVPSLMHIENFLKIRDKVQPKFWAMENVVGSIPDLKPLLGDYRIRMGPYVIWGNFPIENMEVPGGLRRNSKQFKASGQQKMSSNIRAKIPLWLSNQICDAVTIQYQLERYA